MKPGQHPLIQDEDKRIVAGWASVEVKDLQNDIVPVDVLERAMYSFMEKGGIIMYGHQNIPVGRVLRWEIKKHPDTGKEGLWVEAEIFRDYAGDKVWELVKAGKLTGFSISGFGEEKKEKVNTGEKEEVVDVIVSLELSEISIVEQPANPFARIMAVNYYAKSDDAIAECINAAGEISEAETFCRWLVSVYRQYGFETVNEAVEYFTGLLPGKTEKAEGAITTGAGEGYMHETYGGRAVPQVNPEHNVAPSFELDEAVAEEVRRLLVELRESISTILNELGCQRRERRRERRGDKDGGEDGEAE